MKNLCKSVAIILAVLISPSSHVLSFEGPFQVKNLYPIFLHLNQPYMEKASIENSMSYSLSHSSTYTVQESGEWIIHLDMEITELNFRYKRIIKDLFEFDLDIPLIIFGAGFMDGFLEDYHETFGFPDYGRSERPLNEFLYETRRNGELIIQGNSGVRLGDIRLAVKKPLFSSQTVDVSIKGDIEIPVSSAEKGYSNGSIDAGISLLVDKKITEKIITYWNLGAVFPGDVKGHETLDVKNFFYGGSAVEAYVGKGFSLLVQILGQSKIYPTTDLRAVDRAAVMIAFGGRYVIKRNVFDLSMTEDLSESGAPDFIVNLTYKMYI